MSGQGGSSHSLALHTSLEKEREEEERGTVGERCQVMEEQLSSTYFSGEREGGGGKEK